jgi:predicted  nucleic acid-binding Zn-ribbon protein
MTTFPLDIFLKLVDLDQVIVRTDRSIQSLREEIQRVESEAKLLSEYVGKAHDLERESRKAVDRVELQMKELDASYERKTRQLENASNQKEYSASKHEVDSIKKQQHDLETELLQVWKAYEQSQAQYQQKKEEVASKQLTFDSIIQEKMQKIDALEQERVALMANRPAALEGIPAEWLQTYAMMQSRVDNPVVPVENELCSACFYSILRQDMIDLGKRKMLQCRDCFRFLYLPEAYKRD